MTSEIAISSEHLLALITLVWFMVCVCEQVSLEVRPLVETSLAHWTLVRRLLHV